MHQGILTKYKVAHRRREHSRFSRFSFQVPKFKSTTTHIRLFFYFHYFIFKFHNGVRCGIKTILGKDHLPTNSRDLTGSYKRPLNQDSRDRNGAWKRSITTSKSTNDEHKNLDKTGTKIFSTDVRRLHWQKCYRVSLP